MYNQFFPGLPKWLESVRVNIGMPVVRTDGRAVGVRSRDYKFSRMGNLPHFLTHDAPQARFARQSSAIKCFKS